MPLIPLHLSPGATSLVPLGAGWVGHEARVLLVLVLVSHLVQGLTAEGFLRKGQPRRSAFMEPGNVCEG